jgi:carbon storage regulator
MLVLRRKANQTLLLGNAIRVTVLAVEGDRVKLGVDAPPDVLVLREEVKDDPSHGLSLWQALAVTGSAERSTPTRHYTATEITPHRALLSEFLIPSNDLARTCTVSQDPMLIDLKIPLYGWRAL